MRKIQGSESIHVTANEISMKEERSQMLALLAKEQMLLRYFLDEVIVAPASAELCNDAAHPYSDLQRKKKRKRKKKEKKKRVFFSDSCNLKLEGK